MVPPMIAVVRLPFAAVGEFPPFALVRHPLAPFFSRLKNGKTACPSKRRDIRLMAPGTHEPHRKSIIFHTLYSLTYQM